jgi:hypothetical protein
MDPERQRRTPRDAAQQFLAELDRLGEAEVRRLLESDAFAPAQVPFAREWLLRKAEDRARQHAERARD